MPPKEKLPPTRGTSGDSSENVSCLAGHMQTTGMSPELAEAFERARHYKMTPEEVFEQLVSFVYGLGRHDDPRTKDDIRQSLIEMYGRPA